VTAPSAKLKIGFATGATRREVEALERLGADSLWVGGHVASRNPTPEAIVKLARLSALAERAEIGTSILLLPLYPPAIVAKQIADLDRDSGGRIRLGIGVGGEYPAEFRACGVPLAERGKRTDEAIQLLRRLWTAEEITHPGPFYPMEKVRIHPTPLQPGGPPIIVAGRQDVAMRRAAQLGDGWMPYLFSPRRYSDSAQRIRDLAREAGRDLGRFRWTQFLFTCIRDDADDARQQAASFLGGTYNQDFRPLVDRVAAAGTAADVARRVQEFVDAGAREIIFALATDHDRIAQAEQIVGEIAPRIAMPKD
jgi:probable F420-dependent oxidoreductase